MAYRHGVYISEEPTGLLPPVRVNSAMPVALVTAPVHLEADPYGVTNVPKLLFSNREAVSSFGFSMRPEIWDNYIAPEVIHSMFALYGVAPLVMINVLDPKIHNEDVVGESLSLSGFSAVLPAEGVLIDTVVVRGVSERTYEAGVHYTLSFNRDGHEVFCCYTNAQTGIILIRVLPKCGRFPHKQVLPSHSYIKIP